MHDPIMLYKLIILFMLDEADMPLTKAQIGNFILDREYTSFLTLQQAISELTEEKLISAQFIRNRTHLSITPEGKESLGFFGGQINPAIKSDVHDFLQENKIEIRKEASVLADYHRAASGEYEAHLTVKDKGVNLVDITISVPLEETAAAICDNWPQKNQEIYQYLIKQLF